MVPCQHFLSRHQSTRAVHHFLLILRFLIIILCNVPPYLCSVISPPPIIIFRKIGIIITSGCGPHLTCSEYYRIFMHGSLRIKRRQKVENRKGSQYLSNIFLAALPAYLATNQKRYNELHQKVACHGET